MLKQVEIENSTDSRIVVVEPTIGQMLPFIKSIKEDASAGMVGLMKECVLIDGEPARDRLMTLPGGLLSKLTAAISEVTGMNEGEEGNG